MSKPHRKSGCPISFALDVFGDKWSLLIIRDMIFEGKTSFNDFLHSEEKVATNILSNRLQLLEKKGIIRAIHDEHDRRKRRYILTDRGLDLLPLLIELTLWGAHHDPDAEAPNAFMKAALRNKSGLIQQIKAGVKKGRYYCG